MKRIMGVCFCFFNTLLIGIYPQEIIEINKKVTNYWKVVLSETEKIKNNNQNENDFEKTNLIVNFAEEQRKQVFGEYKEIIITTLKAYQWPEIVEKISSSYNESREILERQMRENGN